MIYHSLEGFRLGNDHLGTKHVCCTSEHVKQGKCDNEGEIFMQGRVVGTSSRLFLFPIYLNSTEVEFKVSTKGEKASALMCFVAGKS
jgi:hypothetical protein